MKKKKLSGSFLTVLMIMSFVLSVSAESKVKQNPFLWKFKTGKAVYSTPVIHNNIIYVGSRDKIFYALNSKNGKEIWKFNAKAPIQSTAAVYNNMVYFESGNTLYALTLSGKLVWKSDLYKGKLTDRIDDWDFHHSSPNIVNGVVYIGSEKGIVSGFDWKTGKEKFKCQTQEEYTVRTTPVVKTNKIFFGNWEGFFYSYDIDSQKLIWKYDTKIKRKIKYWKSVIHNKPVIYKNSVIFSGRVSWVFALDINTGKEKWISDKLVSLWTVGGPVLSDNVLYFGGSNSYSVQALDADSGEVLWATSLDNRIWGRSFIGKKYIFAGSGSLYALNKKNGVIRNKIFFDGDKIHSDFKSLDGKTRNGRSWQSNIHSGIDKAGGLLVFGCDDGNIYGIKENTVLNKKFPHGNYKIASARIVMEKIMNKDNRFVQDMAVTPDQLEVYFVQTDSTWTEFNLMKFHLLIKENRWSVPELVNFPGSSMKLKHPSFSPDGKKLYLIDGKSGDNLVSMRTEKGWSRPVKTNIPVNSGHHVLSPDKNLKVFNSNKTGGFGETDLYACIRMENGKWSEPKNLGPAVNTKGYEFDAYFSQEGQRILFTRRIGKKTQTPSKIYSISRRVVDNMFSK